MGWGGPAKGAGARPASPFTADTPTRVTVSCGRGDPLKLAARMERQAIDAAVAQTLMDSLIALALTADTDTVKIWAAEAWLNRVEGLPVARVVSATTDNLRTLSDDALRSELALIVAPARAAGERRALPIVRPIPRSSFS
jgi:hypothetical protein